jgi:hypothetical protein
MLLFELLKDEKGSRYKRDVFCNDCLQTDLLSQKECRHKRNLMFIFGFFSLED